jgi:transposase InsO family protein
MKATARAIASALQVTARAVQKRATKEGWVHEEQACRGGKNRFYLAEKLPPDIHAALLLRARACTAPTSLLPSGPGFSSAAKPAEVSSPANRDELWARFERKSNKQKAQARKALAAIDAALKMIDHKVARTRAFAEAASAHGFSRATLYRLYRDVRAYDRADWLALLVDGRDGRTTTAECSPDAWEFFKADYLRNEAPAASACHERTERAGAEHGWTVPSCATFERRIKREIPRPVLILARQGADALKRAYPAQERDRSVFRALEAVNADGHRFDVFGKWPDGEIGRPVMVAWQDLYSGKIVAYRVDKTENTDAVRLSFGDLVEHHGIPEHAYLDNGRAWASKWMTGGVATRYRFKVKDEEPLGLLTALLGEGGVHWTTPYHGQAKPIERAFRDLCETVAKHPALAGAYTGNKPDAKPENYGSRAVPIETFLTVLAQEIAAHNARKGRRSAVCQGRSFDETFNESYARGPVKKATAEQRRLWLLAAEVASAKTNGEITLATDRRNRYWSPALADHAGEEVTVRFDPQSMHDKVYVYTHDGRFICEAACIEAAGFNDTEAAREHSRARNQFKRAARAMLDAERKMDAVEAAKLLPGVAPGELPQARVVRAFSPATRLETPKPRELDPAERAIQQRLIDEQASPQVVQLHDSPKERYARVCALERRVAGGLPVEESDRQWVDGYRETAEYRAEKEFHESFGLQPGAQAGAQ